MTNENNNIKTLITMDRTYTEQNSDGRFIVPGQNHHRRVDLDQIHTDPVTKSVTEKRAERDLDYSEEKDE